MTIAFNGSANLPIHKIRNIYAKKEPIFLDRKIFEEFGIDKFEPTQKQEIKNVQAPEIGFARVLFNRLKPEQIEEINENRTLPKNAKIVEDAMYGPRLTWNVADITAGTHTLPAGYEFKNDILGFTHLVREGTQAWYLKK